MVSLHIARTLLHTQFSYQAHQEQTTIRHGSISTQTYHQSLYHTRWKNDERTGRLRQSHPRNDRLSQKLSNCTGPTMYCWHRLTYRQILTNSRKPKLWMIPATPIEFWGCRHHQAFPIPILMTTDESRTLCNRSHQLRGCPPINLKASLSACPLLPQPSNLLASPLVHQTSTPPHCLPIFPNVNAIVNGEPHNFAMPQHQPAQPCA